MNIPPEAKPVHPSDRPVEFSPDTPIRYRQLKNMSVKFVSAIGYILWGGVRATSVAAHKDITAILAGTAYGTAYVIDKAIQIPGYLLESGAVLASIQALEPAAREMVTTELEYARTHSDLEGQTVQQTIAYGNYGARGIKVLVSGIPFAAGAAEVASSVLEGYSTVDSLARQASNQNMEVVGKINSYFISFAAKLTPGAFWIASLGAKVAGSLTTFVKNKSFELWTNPEAPQQRMLNVSDRFHSFLTNWWHRYETPSSIQVRDLESFEESGQLTLELFKNFDELYKLKTLAVVFDKASLTPEEREFFLRPEFRNLSKRGDLTRLAQTDPDLKEKLEKKIVEKFNNLSQDARRLAFHLSSEQFRELPQESQQLLFMIVSQRATTKAEKKIIQKLQQNPQLLTENQYINSLLALFDRHYKGNENLAILAKITAKTQSVIVCGEIDTELQKLKSQIPAKSTEELLEINGIIQWLEEQKTLVANSPPPELYAVEANVLTLPSGAPIDATKIDEKIGLWVGTGSTIGECVSPAARILPYFIPGLIFGALPGAATLVAPSIIGYILSPHGIELPKGSSLREYLPKKLMVMEGEKCYLRGSLGCGSFENWLSNHIARATTVTELALLLPFAPGFLISKLGECGIPVDAAEEMLRLFPSAAYSLFWTFVRSIPPALQTISTPFRWLHENIKVVEEYKAGMQTLKDIYGNQTIDAKELTSLYNTFQATLDRICACAPGGKEVFTCNPEIYDVISKPGFWQTMAKDYNLPPESSEFYKSVVDTLQHGKLALPVFTPEEAAHVQEQTAGFLVSASNIGAQAKEKVYSLFTYLYANTIAGTRVEAVGGLAKKTLLATGLPDTLTNEAGRIGAVLSHTAKETSENLSRATFALGKLLGYQQEIPPDVLNILTAISKHYGDKAEKDALKNTALLAIEAYRELVSNWYAKAVGKIAESPDTKDLLEKFMKYLVKPGETIGNVAMTVATIGDRSQKLLDVELKNAQSSSFASSALASSFGLLQKDLSQAAGAAGKLGQQSSLATVSAIGTVLGLASGSYRMLPILLRYAVLPMIKNASSYAVRGGQSICYNIAAKYYDALDSTGRTLEEKCKNLSQACQYAINYLRPSVNDTRIQNFHSLSLNEKNHLIEIAIASRNISGTDKEYILKHKDLPKQTDVEVHKEIARRVIKAYDRLGTDERLLISPTFFELLDSAKQIRIQDLVERTIGLEPYERLDPAAIIAKFNSLASEVKKGIDDFTLMDFGRHSVDEQESILFQIANSQAYRDLMKTKSPSVAWTMEQFHRLQKMPLKELEKLIPLYDQVTPEEKKIYTPASFRALTAKSISDTEIQYLSARLCTLSDTVKTYNSDTVEAIKKAFGPQYDLHKLEDLLHTIQAQEEPFGILLKQRDKLLEALAFACNQLRPHQQHYMLLLTKAELTEMTKEKRNELINYLYAQPFDEGERKILENELAGKTTNPGFLKNAFYLLTGQPSNDDLIVELFNSLPVIVQSDFREQNEQADTVRLQGQEKARNDIKKVSIKLKIINKNLATYSNRLLGRLFIAEKTGDESDTADARALATLVSNLEGKKAEYESQIEALSLMLPEKEQEEYKSQKGPPLPPEWMDYINAATDIAAKEVAKTFDSALDNYLKSLAGTSHDDKKQVDTGGNFLGEILDCFTMNAESVKKEVTRILDKSKETQDPAEQVLLEHKAYFAQKFLGRLQEQHRIEFEKVKQKYEAGAAKSLKRHGLTPLKPEVTPKEELDQLTQKLKHSREGAFLVADSWYVKKNLRVAVDDFKNQKLLTHTDRQIFVEGMAAKKPAFEKKLKTFEALSLDNKLAVITLFLEQKKGIQVDAYIKLLCESVEASHKRKFYEDYLRTEKSQAYLILCKAYESRRKE